METENHNTKAKCRQSVFILPMRNGNSKKEIEAIKKVDGFYLTYEEWKHFEIVNTFKEVNVFILPMRNGN